MGSERPSKLSSKVQASFSADILISMCQRRGEETTKDSQSLSGEKPRRVERAVRRKWEWFMSVNWSVNLRLFIFGAKNAFVSNERERERRDSEHGTASDDREPLMPVTGFIRLIINDRKQSIWGYSPLRVSCRRHIK